MFVLAYAFECTVDIQIIIILTLKTCNKNSIVHNVVCSCITGKPLHEQAQLV